MNPDPLFWWDQTLGLRSGSWSEQLSHLYNYFEPKGKVRQPRPNQVSVKAPRERTEEETPQQRRTALCSTDTPPPPVPPQMGEMSHLGRNPQITWTTATFRAAHTGGMNRSERRGCGDWESK